MQEALQIITQIEARIVSGRYYIPNKVEKGELLTVLSELEKSIKNIVRQQPTTNRLQSTTLRRNTSKTDKTIIYDN